MPATPSVDSGGGRSGGSVPNLQGAVNRTQQTAQNMLSQLQGQYNQQRQAPSVTTNSSGQYVRPMAPPQATPGPVQDIGAYLGADSGYQDQLRQYALALNNFMADLTRRRGTLETDYGTSKKAMDDQRVKDLDLLEDDYGARGLLRSGLYAGAVGDYEKEFGERSSDLSRRQQEAMGALSQEEGNFKSQQQLKEQAAKEQAIARRAAQYGL